MIVVFFALIMSDLINEKFLLLILSPLVGYISYLLSLLLYGRFKRSLIVGIFAYKTYLCEMRYFKRRLHVLSVCVIEELLFRYVPINYLNTSDNIRLLTLSLVVSVAFTALHYTKSKQQSMIKHLDLFVFAMILFFVYFYTFQITFVILIHYYKNIFVICCNDKITYNRLKFGDSIPDVMRDEI